MSATPVAAAMPPAVEHPLRLPHFRNLWMGWTISLLGDQFYLVALPWLVLQLTGSSLALGTILMTAAIPRAVLMLMGGAVSDRFSPRRIMMTTAGARTVLVAAVAALTGWHVIQLWHLYLLAFAFGVADAFGYPAGAAFMPSLVSPPQLPAANATFQGTAQLGQMLGPAPAGLVVKQWGMATAFWIDAFSFLGVIAALFKIPDPPRREASPGARKPGMLGSIRAGFEAVLQDKPLLSLMLLATAMNLCLSGPITVGLATLSKFTFKSSAAYGTLLSCFSAGALGGMLAAGALKRAPHRGLMLAGVGALLGASLIAIGLEPKFVAVAVALVVMGLGAGFNNVHIASWIQARVDRAVMGRVMSVLMLSSVGLMPISFAIAGVVAQINLAAMFLSAGALILGVSIWALFSPAVRAIE